MRNASGVTASALPAVAAVLLLMTAAAAKAADCRSLIGKKFGEAVIIEVNEVTPPFAVTGMAGSPVAVNSPFCRARGVITPTRDSNIGFELWLPPAAAWNGKYQGTGNGGFGGSLTYAHMDNALGAGYAVSGTDTGHIDLMGSSRTSAWALGQPEKQVDYGWRAIHETAVASKAIIAAYYDRTPSRSYFVGCSSGGRQALVEAKRFPREYDGMVVGAPGHLNALLLSNNLGLVRAVGAASPSGLAPAKLAALNKAALAACPSSESVIDDPSQCKFDPAALACKPGESGSCLEPAELAAVQRIYGGLRDKNGRTVLPGYTPGSELQWTWAPGSRLDDLVKGYFRHMVTGDLAWDGHGIEPLDAHALARANAVQYTDLEDPDLGEFQRAGGKIIQYHGWSDASIPTGTSISMYESQASRFGGIERTQSFYRLFLAPGMGHCRGGSGPFAVGGNSERAPRQDPEHDVVAALDRWVETGQAPERITATRYRDNDPRQEVTAQRPWCVYPAVARYVGEGKRTDASSYRCVAPGG